MLEAFITDEEHALALGVQGHFYPAQHHRIKPLLRLAPRLLSAERRVDLYFQLMRMGQCPALQSDSELQVLTLAYDQLRPLFSRGTRQCLMRRPQGLLLFGNDDRGALAGEPPASLESYLAWLKLWRYLDSFIHMPGLLKQQARFATLSDDPGVLGRVVRVVERIDPVDDLLGPTELCFWAFMWLALQRLDAAERVTQWLMRVDCPQALRLQLLSHLRRFLQASPHGLLVARDGLDQSF